MKNKGKGVGKKSKPQNANREKVKKKILQDSNDTSMSDVNLDELCQDDDNDDAGDASNLCLVCGEFGRDNENGTGGMVVMVHFLWALGSCRMYWMGLCGQLCVDIC